MKRNHKFILVGLIAINFIILGIILFKAFLEVTETGKWIQTLGLTLGLTGVFQTATSEFFTKILDHLKKLDDKNEPLPSHLIREVIEDPDRPTKTKIRSVLFFDPRTGFKIIVLSFLIELLGVWVSC